MKTRKILALTLAAAAALTLLSACGGKQNAPGGSSPAPGGASQSQPQTPGGSASEPPVEDGEDYTTGDASLDNPRNQDGIGETELLVVSFGTSFNDNRRLTIGAIEEAMEKAFPDYSVRRGFTAQIVIDHIQRRDGEVIDNVGQALDRAADNGVKTLIVQPTHLMNGFEYNDVVDEVAQYADAFDRIIMGAPCSPPMRISGLLPRPWWMSPPGMTTAEPPSASWATVLRRSPTQSTPKCRPSSPTAATPTTL